MNKNTFKLLVNAYYDYQMLSIQQANRLMIKKDGSKMKNQKIILPEEDQKIIGRLHDVTKQQMKEIDKIIKKEITAFPIWNEFLKDVHGISHISAAILISQIDIEKARYASSLWKYCGIYCNPETGKAVKREKGVKNEFNQWLKSKMLGVIAPNFIRLKSPYVEIYYNRKHRQISKGWADNDKKGKNLHYDLDARRVMMKYFLIDLYRVWRKLEGLEFYESYKEKYLDKHHKKEN